MSNPYQDPVVKMLREISAKQDVTIAKQEAMDKRLAEIQADTDWRGAVQEFEAERARQNGWQGWHPPFEPADE